MKTLLMISEHVSLVTSNAIRILFIRHCHHNVLKAKHVSHRFNNKDAKWRQLKVFKSPHWKGFVKEEHFLRALHFPRNRASMYTYSKHDISTIWNIHHTIYFLAFLLLNCLRVVQNFQKPKPLSSKNAHPYVHHTSLCQFP